MKSGKYTLEEDTLLLEFSSGSKQEFAELAKQMDRPLKGIQAHRQLLLDKQKQKLLMQKPSFVYQVTARPAWFDEDIATLLVLRR